MLAMCRSEFCSSLQKNVDKKSLCADADEKAADTTSAALSIAFIKQASIFQEAHLEGRETRGGRPPLGVGGSVL